MPRVATEDGYLDYAVQGSGPITVLLHGIQGTARSWGSVTRMLAEDATIVVPNMRGRAPSFVPTGLESYTLPHFADDLDRLLDEIGEPATIVAWSMGGLVTFEYLQQGGNSIRSLILAGTTACPGEEARWFQGASLDAIAEEAENRAKALGLQEYAPAETVASSWWHVRRADYRPLLPSIAVPTLVLHGGKDQQCPMAHGRLLAEQIPDSELRIWPEAGHNIMEHNPLRFSDLVSHFSSRH